MGLSVPLFHSCTVLMNWVHFGMMLTQYIFVSYNDGEITFPLFQWLVNTEKNREIIWWNQISLFSVVKVLVVPFI